jgi:hypothetical protein
MSGWFKHPRNLDGSFDPNPTRDAELSLVYLHLVKKANWEDSATLKSGQVRTSVPDIQKSICFLSEGETKHCVKVLCKLGLIEQSRASKWTTSGSIFTVIDYATKFAHISTHDPIHACITPALRLNTPPESLDNVTDHAFITPALRFSVSKQETKKQKKESSLSESESKEDNLSYLDLATEWNKRLPNHTQVNLTILRKNDKRKSDIRKSIEKHSSELLISAIDKISSSDFLCGKNDRNWKPELPWIIKTENLQKVIEGKYENKDKQQDKRAFLK